MANGGFWKGRRVFLTGHTGFKGGWLATWLLEKGARVTGYALAPDTRPSYFALCGLAERMQSIIGDVRDADHLRRAVAVARPEVVFHLAAQPLVRRSYAQPIATYATNVMGTAHLLEATGATRTARSVVVITSDKCYESGKEARPHAEGDPLGGKDPYSSSKACAEMVVRAWRESFYERAGRPVGLATVRAGNVIGGGDWAEDRLVPDAIKALQRSRPVTLRNPRSVRPWQHVLEPLSGYLRLAQILYEKPGRGAGAWNFGPARNLGVTTSELARMIVRAWGDGSVRCAPDSEGPPEAATLRLDSAKARRLLGWRPRLSLAAAVEMTVDWYRRAHAGDSTYEISVEQIRAYERGG